MEKVNIIFEKKFPQMTMEEYDAIVDQNSKVAVPLPRPDCEAICRKILEESVRIVIPGRTEVRENFIAQAKELADYYAINTTVMEYEDRLTASFSVDSNDSYSELRKIIQLSDDLSFCFNNGTMKLLLTFYTHATYFEGRRITPEAMR